MKFEYWSTFDQVRTSDTVGAYKKVWKWRLLDSDGSVLLSSHPLVTKLACEKSIRSTQRIAPIASIVEMIRP